MQFEEKYLDRLVAMANKTKGATLEEKILKTQNCSEALKMKLKELVGESQLKLMLELLLQQIKI